MLFRSVLLQSSGAIIMKQVVINIHNNIEQNLSLSHGQEWEQMLMIHDEVQVSCKPEHTEQIREQALQAFPQAGKFFGFKCTIDGDSRVGKTWADTH